MFRVETLGLRNTRIGPPCTGGIPHPLTPPVREDVSGPVDALVRIPPRILVRTEKLSQQLKCGEPPIIPEQLISRLASHAEEAGPLLLDDPEPFLLIPHAGHNSGGYANRSHLSPEQGPATRGNGRRRRPARVNTLRFSLLCRNAGGKMVGELGLHQSGMPAS